MINLTAFDSTLPQQPFSTDTAVVMPYTSSNEDIVAVKMIAEEKTLRPGKTFWVCFQFTIAPDWHLYWKNPGDAGAPPTIIWDLPEGFTVGDVMWPFPDRYEVDNSVLYGYSRQALLLAPIHVPDTVLDGQRDRIKAQVQWLACSTTCVPGNAFFSAEFPVSTREAQLNLSAAPLFRQARRWLPVESTMAKAVLDDSTIEIEVFPKVALDKIVTVQFFPDEKDLIDIHAQPSWEVYNNGNRFVLQIKDEKLKGKNLKFPINGVLVIKDSSSVGTKNHAWAIHVESGKIEKKTLSQTAEKAKSYEKSKEHIEALEKKIWYRSILDSFSSISQSELVKIMLLAFVGGMILNVMPCVLPVISMKMLQFVQLQQSSRMAVLKHGLLYSLGVLVSFWLLAGAIYLLQYFGYIVGWGFQLQEPYFVAALVLILFVLSLGMFGVFEFGVSFASKAGNFGETVLDSKKRQLSYGASFVSGVLATFVASPCTGPLLGSAIGFAATLHPTFAFMVFSSLGLGMAFPFLVFPFIPGVSRLIPRPGQWLITFKQLMGFFLLATVLWLAWVLDAETRNLSLITMLTTLFVVGFGTWVYGTWASFDRPKNTQTIAKIVAALIVLWGGYLLFSEVKVSRSSAKEPVTSLQRIGKEWGIYSQEKLDRLLQRKMPVFVAVTAKWCLTCHANHAILDMDKVSDAFTRYGVEKLVADWTTGDEEITKFLRSHGRNGVPMYVVYSRDPKIAPIVLPEVITPEIVIDAIRDAAIPPEVPAKPATDNKFR